MILGPDKLDRLISRAPYFMVGGFALIIADWLIGIGIITGISLLGLGAILASVSDYRTEPGLWMLASLYGVLYFCLTLLCEYCSLMDIVRGAIPAGWQVVVDFAIAMRLQWLLVQAMATVVVYNRRLADTRE